MCIIERKIYLHRDGTQDIVEKPRPCPRAIGSHLCRKIERVERNSSQVIETRPSIDSRSSSDGLIVTEGKNGRRRVYHDLSKRSSNTSSVRYSNTALSDRSAISVPSSASSPSPYEMQPAAPTSPPAGQGFPFPERSRMPYSSLGPPEPTRIVTPEGTAIYDRPPSLELPRASNNERPSSSAGETWSSYSNTQAEVNDDVEPVPEALPTRSSRRPSLKIRTTTLPSTTSSTQSVESPGLSNLPKVGSLRRDYGKDVPRRDSKRPETRRIVSDTQRRSTTEDRRHREAQARRQKDEDDRQASLERDRLAGTDRRQSGRDQLARESSRERHLKATAEALERPAVDDDWIQQQQAADFAQMARERRQAEERRRGSNEPLDYSGDQLRQDADAYARYQATRNSPTATRLPVRRVTGEYTSSPLSARTSAPAPAPAPVVHQYPSARHSGTIRGRGEEIIARERARGATDRLNTVMSDMTVDDPYYDEEYDLVDDYYVTESQQPVRRPRPGERERRRWR